MRILTVFYGSNLKFLCIPIMAFYLIFCNLPDNLFCSAILRSRHLPSSANPAITRWRVCSRFLSQETRNMSLVMPLSSIFFPVIPLLHRAKKIHEMFVLITFPLKDPKLLKRSITPLSMRKLIDRLFNAKWTRAKVLYSLTMMSSRVSLHRDITKSITLFSSSSSNIPSW